MSALDVSDCGLLRMPSGEWSVRVRGDYLGRLEARVYKVNSQSEQEQQQEGGARADVNLVGAANSATGTATSGGGGGGVVGGGDSSSANSKLVPLVMTPRIARCAVRGVSSGDGDDGGSTMNAAARRDDGGGAGLIGVPSASSEAPAADASDAAASEEVARTESGAVGRRRDLLAVEGYNFKPMSRSDNGIARAWDCKWLNYCYVVGVEDGHGWMLYLTNPDATYVYQMTFTKRSVSNLVPLTGIAINNNNNLLIVGKQGACYHSNDRGATISTISDCKIPSDRTIKGGGGGARPPFRSCRFGLELYRATEVKMRCSSR